MSGGAVEAEAGASFGTGEAEVLMMVPPNPESEPPGSEAHTQS